MPDRPPLEVPDPVTVHQPDAADRIVSAVTAHGIARVRGVATEHALLRVAHWLGTVEHHPDSGPTGVTTLRPSPAAAQPGRAGFTAEALPPHTDRASVAQPPMLLVLACQRPARRGGATVLVDGRAPAGRPPRTVSGGTAHPVQPRRGVLRRRQRLQRPGVHRRAPRDPGDPVEHRPALTTLPLARPWHATLGHLISEHTHTVLLGAGDGLVVHNRWWLHGRREFRGDRVPWRILVNPHPH
ncbi:TauD/TfdA family dioxygenase [Amycolatopsis magusensis]|uniref:TauD/TfdA family dioxygenase n=1 Tax=Amycolatopsis magusensis TaxID=882444 RepID=UPI0024A8079B|nr:TauD/TfdA family dioxygenase [Amycolatopsis magusensis]MDI5975939.1 TauD/TfdA family dioxygenase [Amycolatopsis magusensis]